MQSKGQHRYIIIIGIFIVLCLFLAIYWQTSAVPPPNQAMLAAKQDTVSASTATTSNPPSSAMPMFSSQSQQDTQINCQFSLDQQLHLMVNAQTKDCFEYFISQFGEKTIAQIKTDFQHYILATYANPASAEILDLWSRYLNYRKALGELPEPHEAKESVKYFQALYNNIQNLRQTYFSSREIEGLFGPEDLYQIYTLKRLSILEDATLSASEKAKRLKALFDDLPEDWKATLEQISTLDNLKKLTADLKARNASAEEIHQMRTNLVGAEATQRLETLDQQRNEWKNRVTQYLSARQQILQSGLTDNAKQQAIDTLKNQQFSDKNEILRLKTFEKIDDTGGPLPFHD